MKYFLTLFVLAWLLSCSKEEHSNTSIEVNNDILLRSEDIFDQIQQFTVLMESNSGSIHPDNMRILVEATINSKYSNLGMVSYEDLDVQEQLITIEKNRVLVEFSGYQF